MLLVSQEFLSGSHFLILLPRPNCASHRFLMQI
jgi:hypothetical protein